LSRGSFDEEEQVTGRDRAIAVTHRVLLVDWPMGDVKLTPRQTARLLTHIEEGVRQLTEVREQLIDAMARRAMQRPQRPKRVTDTRKPDR
jgi:hypothetical protein